MTEIKKNSSKHFAISETDLIKTGRAAIEDCFALDQDQGLDIFGRTMLALGLIRGLVKINSAFAIRTTLEIHLWDSRSACLKELKQSQAA
ncbi:MAG: hypothetical protein COB04_18445 [Gammaproteobacteria bacterium]|nr:MAG: hypothetical protein COB04_18445 [Gammaproteobacteria bacterium]